MGSAGKPVMTYQEYLERCIKSTAKGMELCAGDPMKLAQHQATKRAYENALRAFEKFFVPVNTKEEIWN